MKLNETPQSDVLNRLAILTLLAGSPACSVAKAAQPETQQQSTEWYRPTEKPMTAEEKRAFFLGLINEHVRICAAEENCPPGMSDCYKDCGREAFDWLKAHCSEDDTRLKDYCSEVDSRMPISSPEAYIQGLIGICIAKKRCQTSQCDDACSKEVFEKVSETCKENPDELNGFCGK